MGPHSGQILVRYERSFAAAKNGLVDFSTEFLRISTPKFDSSGCQNFFDFCVDLGKCILIRLRPLERSIYSIRPLILDK
ncbi:hypothetical protein B9Z55_021718 [Caenorhabditis nigoni]|uniref:Uncharacterized protein n=1 Tax=Caenorhabditis nigoni TaxID=1611254 RepID=A0A2G5TTS2_9PELO|nr:hypothetical protein B9Z55_021718 [Caenorhabditis nigoni]